MSWGNFNAALFGSDIVEQNTGWDINNMNDLYQYWYNTGGGAAYESGGQSFQDWVSSGGIFSTEGDFPGAAFGDQFGDFTLPGSGPGSGGGASGGAGDIGWGNMFTGGAYEGGITNPFGTGWGPEGQFGEGGGGSGIDPDYEADSWCFDAWQASGAADSYADFAAAMCP